MTKRFHTKALLFAALTMVLGILTTGYLYQRISELERNYLERQFDQIVQNQVEGLNVQFNKDLTLLSSIRDLIHTYPSLSASNFKKFTRSRIANTPYVVGLEWLPRISRSERDQFERRVRERFSNFSIRELSDGQRKVIRAGSREVYYPVTYVEPLDKHPENRLALGFDHASVPERRAAMKRARESGEPVATPITTLWRLDTLSSKGDDPTSSLGYIVFQPVYVSGESTAPGDRSERALHGYVAAVIRVSSQIKNAMSLFVLQKYENVFVFENGGTPSERLIYSSSPQGVFDPRGQQLSDLQDPYLWRTPLNVAKQSWTFVAMPKHTFLEINNRYESWAALATGLVVTFLLTGYVYQNLSTRSRIQHEVEERTRELSREKSRFRAVAENAGEAILTVDTEGIITFYNDAAEQIFGYHVDEILGSRLTVILPGVFSDCTEDATHENSRTSTAMDALYNKLQTNQGMPLEMSAVRKGGGEYPIELSVGKWFDEEQAFYTLIIRDITERKQQEKELKLFNDLVNQSNDSIFIVDPNKGRIEEVNETACRTLGYPREEIVGMHATDIERSAAHGGHRGPDEVEPSDVEAAGEFLQEGAWEEHVREVIEQGSMLFECQLSCSDGSTIPVEMNVRYVTSDEQNFLVKVARDIQERKKTELKLRRHQKLLSESQKMAHLGSFEWDPVEDRLTWSRELYRIFGTDPDSMRPTFEAFLDRIHPDDVERVRRTVEDALEEGRDFELEERIVRPDGEVRYLESKGEIQCDSSGQPKRVRGICLDITERKQAEQQIREMNQRLEEEVENRTKELEQFVYAASHDLREPLRVLQNYTEFLNEDLSRTNERIEEDLHFINQAATRMNRLVNSLLKLSRVGRSELDLKQINLNVCVDGALQNLKMAVDDAGAEIIREDLPTLSVDETLIVDLYQNLIGNALKYSEQRPLVIRLTAEKHSGEWVLGVKDNGVGIEPENHEDIFQPFVHLHEDQSENGTGIGLSICKRIVKRHGGELWVESEPGEGSHFRFTLHPERTLEGIPRGVSTVPDEALAEIASSS